MESAPFVLARRVVEALTDGTQPDRLVVFVDDAHLLDDLSSLVLHQLVQSQAAAVILTIRTGEAAPAAVTALWKDGLLRRCELEPLTRSEIDDCYWRRPLERRRISSARTNCGISPAEMCYSSVGSSNRSTERDGWWPSRASSGG